MEKMLYFCVYFGVNVKRRNRSENDVKDSEIERKRKNENNYNNLNNKEI